MSSLSDSPRRRIALADLEHYDEPSPEDAAELDEQVWKHIDNLLVGFAGECDEDADGDQLADDEEADDLEVDEGPAGAPPVALPFEAPVAEPVPPSGPLSGALRQLALGWGVGESPATKGRRPDRTRPGDAPGWKGGA